MILMGKECSSKSESIKYSTTDHPRIIIMRRKQKVPSGIICDIFHFKKVMLKKSFWDEHLSCSLEK